MNYNRMNPNLTELVDRLDAYSKIDYGAEAYPLSVAEAALLVRAVKTLSLDVENPSDYDLVYQMEIEDYVEPELPRDWKIKPLISSITGKPLITRGHDMSQLYLDGYSVEQIAKIYNVTNERIRQCIAKVHRQSTK